MSVVTHNNASCLGPFLESLERQTVANLELFFYDNASVDDTVSRLGAFGKGTVHVSSSNDGYCRGHNHNISLSQGEYVLILNPDLEFAAEMVERLAACMDAHADQAITGPTIVEGTSARPFPPRKFYPGEGMVPLEPGFEREEIAWVNGCCMMIRHEALNELRGFDEDYFVYQSETDLCLRARMAGYKIGFCEEVTVHHLHRQSQPDLSEYEYARQVFDGSAVFWQKHYSPSDADSMIRFQYRAASLLLAVGTLLRPFASKSHVLSAERLRARRDVCAQLLENRANGRGIESKRAPIMLRQWRLLMEWAKQGHFPLDDY